MVEYFYFCVIWTNGTHGRHISIWFIADKVYCNLVYSASCHVFYAHFLCFVIIKMLENVLTDGRHMANLSF